MTSFFLMSNKDNKNNGPGLETGPLSQEICHFALSLALMHIIMRSSMRNHGQAMAWLWSGHGPVIAWPWPGHSQAMAWPWPGNGWGQAVWLGKIKGRNVLVYIWGVRAGEIIYTRYYPPNLP